MLMWEQTDAKGIWARCYFEGNTFTVEVGHGSLFHTYVDAFPANYTPTFGMDVIDARESTRMAEKLVKQLEKETGL